MITKEIVAPAGTTWVQSNKTDETFMAFVKIATGRIIAGSNGYGIWYSDDNGINWTQSNMTINNWHKLYYIDSRILAISQSDGIWYSDDNGVSWAQSNITDDYWYCIIKVSDSKLLACGTGYGAAAKGIYQSTDNGETWTQINQLTDKGVTWLLKHSTGRIFAIVGGAYNEIWYSDDNSETWTQLTLSFISNDTTISYMSEGLNGRLLIYVSDGVRVLYSDDLGLTWVSSSMSDPNIVFTMLYPTLVTSFNKLIAYARIWHSLQKYVSTVILSSNDNGETWYIINTLSAQTELYVYFYKPIELSSNRLLCTGNNTGIWYSDPEYADVYDSKPLTKKELQELITECKAYVQSKKQP